MSEGIDVDRVQSDLYMARPPSMSYDYQLDEAGNVIVAHNDAAGYIIGTQAVTITLGEFKATE